MIWLILALIFAAVGLLALGCGVAYGTRAALDRVLPVLERLEVLLTRLAAPFNPRPSPPPLPPDPRPRRARHLRPVTGETGTRILVEE